MIATPTPIARPSALAAVPSAELAASEFAEERRVSAPPVSVTPSAIDATDELSAIVSEIAAPTETPLPPLSSALGAAVVPEPPPAGACASAAARSCATWPSTPPAGAPGWPSPGAPSADAVDVADAVEEPSAWKETAPAAARFRASEASTSWSAKVSASATPTAASSASEPPLAVVTADAVCSAFASTAPVSGIAAPVPIVARLETFEIATATAGAIATEALAAPVSAAVVRPWPPAARSVRSPPATSVAPSAIDASRWSLTIAIAIEAPIPTVSGVGPPSSTCAGSAFTVDTATDSAASRTAPVPASSEAPVESSEVVVIV